MSKKKKGKYMKIMLALIVIQVIVYTWVHLFLSYAKGIEIAPMTSAAFYGFCGVEAGVCGWIRNNKKEE
jgi:hypothetical protein